VTSTDDDPILLSLPELAALLARIFRVNGCSEMVAETLARNCAMAEAAGSYSHGVFRIDGYISTLRSGWVDGRAVPVIEQAAPGFLRVDAQNGFAQPSLSAARTQFETMIRHTGIALLAIRNSHHFGALWPDVEPFADDGLIALSVVNSFACVVPVGGTKPLFGTNPISFAAPVAGAAPLVFDFATTVMAHGDVQIAAREGRSLPPGVGCDKTGAPTQDPAKILDGGALLPFGGHKGSAISMMIELLAAGLTGGNFSFEFDWSDHPGAKTPKTGQLLIGIDPAHAGGDVFARRSRNLIDALTASGYETYPGARRAAGRRAGGDERIPISHALHASLKGYANGEL